MEQTILAIDIGSTKICTIIAEIRNGVPTIIGVGNKPSKGIRKGTIVSMEQASSSIRESIREAKRIVDVQTSKAIVSLSGIATNMENSWGTFVPPGNGEITLKEINRVMQNALYNVDLLEGYEVIHTLPYSFKIDGKELVDDPLGMTCKKLEVATHIVMAKRSSIDNIKRVINNADPTIEIEEVVLNAYASAIAVLLPEEKELGVACVDIGGNTCDLMIHYGNSMQYNNYLGVGSHNITHDLSITLSTPIKEAERIKLEEISLSQLSQEELEKLIDIQGLDINSSTKKASIEQCVNVAAARVDETLRFISKFIDESTLRRGIGAGLVITGGMAKMKGLKDFAQEIFPSFPVRVASPVEIDGAFDIINDPTYATSMGLVLYAAGGFTNYCLDAKRQLKYNKDAISPVMKEEGKSDLSDLSHSNEEMSLKRQANKQQIKQQEVDEDRKSASIGDRVAEWFKGLF